MRTREAMLWELEEKHIHEKHQLSKRHVKELCFMQRHQMIIRHEKELDQIKKYDDKILYILLSSLNICDLLAKNEPANFCELKIVSNKIINHKFR